MTQLELKQRYSEFIHSEWNVRREEMIKIWEHKKKDTDKDKEIKFKVKYPEFPLHKDRSLSEYNWMNFFDEYKNYAQDILGISPIDRWMKDTYPDAYKTDGTLRKDWDIKMGLKQPKPKTKKTKKSKPDPIIEEIPEPEPIEEEMLDD